MPSKSNKTTARTNKEVIVMFVPRDESDYVPNRVYDLMIVAGVFTWRCVGQTIPSNAHELLRFEVDPIEYRGLTALLDEMMNKVSSLESRLEELDIRQPPRDINSVASSIQPSLSVRIMKNVTMQMFGRATRYRDGWGYTTEGVSPTFEQSDAV